MGSRGGREPNLAFPIAFYLCTLFLGAGLFNLPLQAAHIGGGLLLLMLLLSGAVSAYFYCRIATRLVGETSDALHGEASGHFVRAAGGGRSANLLSLSGVGIYVLGATFSYAALGVAALLAIAALIQSGAIHAWPLLLLGLALVALRTQLPERLVISRRLSALSSLWAVGLGVLVVDDGATYRLVIASITFVLGTAVVVMSGRPGSATVESQVVAAGKLETPHQTAVTGLLIQFCLMFVILAIVVGVVLAGPLEFSWSSFGPAGDVSPTSFIKPISTIVFALVSTALVTMNVYRPMSEPAFRKTVVIRAIMIVLTALSVWLVASTVLLGREGLGGLDEDDVNTAIGMASGLSLDGGLVATALTVLGSLVTLIAVTGATAGFTSSLVSEGIGAAGCFLPGRGQLRKKTSERVVMVLIAGSAGTAALGSSGGEVLSSVLAVSGIAGGSVVLFTMPMLAVRAGDKRLPWAIAAIVVAVVCGLFATYVVVQSGVHGVGLVPAMAVAWLPSALTVLTARGVAFYVPVVVPVVTEPSTSIEPASVLTVDAPQLEQVFPVLTDADQAIREQALAEMKDRGGSASA